MKVVKIIKDVAFFLYQWLVFVPIFIVLTILTALIVMIFSPIFGNKFWGYYPPKWWSKLTCWLALCKVKVVGREFGPKAIVCFAVIIKELSIFLVYGFLNQNIKWVQKKQFEKIR